MSKSIAFKTLGCRLNQYETEAIATEAHKRGFNIIDFHSHADAYVINSCTVTKQSDHKSQYYINAASKRKHKPVIVLTGCMVDNHKKALQSNDAITYSIDNDKKASIPSLLDAHFKGEIFPEQFIESGTFNYGSAQQIFHTRSMIKIQDGCDNMCSFCIIPKVRGRAQSRSPKNIIKNITQNIINGFKEIVLTGVNIGRYNYDNTTFEMLIEQILAIDLDFRLRISSLEPDGFSENFASLFQHPKLMPHLHLCVQSGSDKILMQMRRMYTVQSYMRFIDSIKKRNPLFNFTTDLIVGFPGETQHDFQNSIDIVKEVGFSHVHTFKYSQREGTRADRMPQQIPSTLKEERSKIIRDISYEQQKHYMSQFIGLEEEILTETTNTYGMQGYGKHYVPIISASAKDKNKIQNVIPSSLISINNKPVLLAD